MDDLDVSVLARFHGQGRCVIPYLALLAIPLWFAFALRRNSRPADVQARWQWRLFLVLMTLMIGLRFEVGGDWDNYVDHVDLARDLTWHSALNLDGSLGSMADPAYWILVKIATIWGDVYFVNFVCALIFTWGLAAFCLGQPNPWLAMCIAVPYLVIVVAMGYTRQGVAIGLAMLGIQQLMSGKSWRFFLSIALAACFHKSAVILIPLAVFSASRHRWTTLVGALAIGTIAFLLLLSEALEILFRNYVQAEYQSSGALIRVAMNALPAALFLILYRRFKEPPEVKKFWLWMCWGALLFLPILALSPSSTAVDRIALYWIPIQIFVLSRLPDVCKANSKLTGITRGIILTYSTTVLLVWLFLGVHSYAWLPYRFLPLESLIRLTL